MEDAGRCFVEARERALSRLRDVSLDKAPAGGVDAGAVAIVNAVNSKAMYVTTSSCAGRCALYAGDGKRGGRWLWLSHDGANGVEILSALNSMSGEATLVVLKFEPPILHVRCANIISAEKLVKTALGCGFRESGISSVHSLAGPLAAIRSTAAALEVPLGHWSGQGWQWRIPDENIEHMASIATARLDTSRSKLRRLVEAIVSIDSIDKKSIVISPDVKTHCVIVPKRAARRVKVTLGSRFNKQVLIDAWGPAEKEFVAIPFLGLEEDVRKVLDADDIIEFTETQLRPKQHALAKKKRVNTRSWSRLGTDALLVPSDFESDDWNSIASAAGVQRLFRDTEVDPDETRACRRELLFSSLSDPSDTWVTIKENGLSLSFDAAFTMFCFGNAPERLRHASFNCQGQTIVDLYAGIGYFSLPLLKAGAAFLHACEWSPVTARALRRNLHDNGFAHKATVYEMDNQLTASKLANTAHRISLGLTPSCRKAWPLACDLLHIDGGFLHLHENHKVLIQKDASKLKSHTTSSSSSYRTAFDAWGQDVARHINAILQDRRPEGVLWQTTCLFVSKVKSYAPHVFHLVADLQCTSSSSATSATTTTTSAFATSVSNELTD